MFSNSFSTVYFMLLIRICTEYKAENCCILLACKEISYSSRDSKATLGFIALMSILGFAGIAPMKNTFLFEFKVVQICARSQNK